MEKFLRGRMHGEGDVMRHLTSLGLRLGYEQDPRTEFDFALSSLAIDLRSGVRLLRLTELLTGPTVMSKCSCSTYAQPAASDIPLTVCVQNSTSLFRRVATGLLLIHHVFHGDILTCCARAC